MDIKKIKEWVSGNWPIVLFFVLVWSLPIFGVYRFIQNPEAYVVECSDFETQEAAQDFFRTHEHISPGDVLYLDGDGDSIACESLL